MGENSNFLECPSASEIIMPSVRCCLAAPKLIRTNFLDVRSHPVELNRCPSDPGRNSPNVRSSGSTLSHEDIFTYVKTHVLPFCGNHVINMCLFACACVVPQSIHSLSLVVSNALHTYQPNPIALICLFLLFLWTPTQHFGGVHSSWCTTGSRVGVRL